MSQIKKVSTEFRKLKPLVEALKQAGIPESAIEVDETLSNSLKGKGYVSDEDFRASIVIREGKFGRYEDAGFRYDPQTKTFQAVLSTHDNDQNFGEKWLVKTKVRYNIIEAKRLAAENGYEITERWTNGTVQLECNKVQEAYNYGGNW